MDLASRDTTVILAIAALIVTLIVTIRLGISRVDKMEESFIEGEAREFE